MPKRLEWIVTPQESGLPLHRFIAQHIGPNFSIKAIKRLLESGACQLNGHIERFANFVVGRGDKISLSVQQEQKTKTLQFPIIWSDADFFAIDKPAGIVSEEIPHAAIVKKIAPSAALAHRLDRDTTGALLLGRSPESAQLLMNLFRARKVKKVYYAWVDGNIINRSGLIDNYLGKKATYHGQALWGEVSSSEGVRALTRWEVLQQGQDMTFVACYPETGRTHQIRVHMSEMGHPILGDSSYGRSFKSTYHAPRCLLHCAEMDFVHPKTGLKITVKAPLPDDMQKVLKI